MEVYLKYPGIDIWRSVEDKYELPKEIINESEETDEHIVSRIAPIDLENRRRYEWNAREKNALLCGLVHVKFTKVMQCTKEKKIQDKLERIYEGVKKVKKAKLQTCYAQFETLKIKQEEDIATYFLRVDEIVNFIKGLGEMVKEY